MAIDHSEMQSFSIDEKKLAKNDVVDADNNDDADEANDDDDDDGDDEENDADDVVDGATCRMRDSDTKGIGSV